MTSKRRFWAGVAGVAAGALVVGNAGQAVATTSRAALKVSTADAQDAAETYAELVSASYDASIASATALRTAVDAFIANPTQATLDAARQAWVSAREDYTPTEAFRFYDGPIDDADDGLEGQINAWPMDEAYVDGVEGNPNAGIVNDVTSYPAITADVLVEANEEGGETNISTGWHAIEFLLWGQDTSPSGPGQRPFTDYTTAPNAGRRAEYLKLSTDQLVQDLESVRAQWDPESGEYREEFLEEPRQAITNILQGIGMLSAHELAGERMAVAYETQDQEDEHSCFSDNTNADVVADVEGVRRVYFADLPGVEGTSISDLVAQVKPALDTKLTRQLDASMAAAEDFPAPFEQLIAADDRDPGRRALLTAITAIEDQGATIAKAAKALGVKINVGG